MPARSNSPDHNAKGTQSEMTASEEPAPPPTACRHVVSGSISLASRRAFHLSLTVLVHYRSQDRISPWQMVLPDSTRISRVPAYSGCVPSSRVSLRLQGSHLLRQRFPAYFDSPHTINRRICRSLQYTPTTPQEQRLQPVTPSRFGLIPFRSPLLRESRLFPLPQGT